MRSKPVRRRPIVLRRKIKRAFSEPEDDERDDLDGFPEEKSSDK